MGSRTVSPEAILPTRMTLQVPPETDIRFSVLDFPYARVLSAFMKHFQAIYERQNDESLPYSLRLPQRQLNDAILSLAPGLVQAFEFAKESEEYSWRMVAFTRYGQDGQPEDIPTLGQLQSLIRHWVERWGELPDVKAITDGDGKTAWQTLLNALKGAPETQWRHGITPVSLAADPSSEDGLGYVALPALLTALLHGQEMTLNSEKGAYPLTWRRANDGGKNGLHIVSNPLRYADDYFAYRLDFSVQTQAGYVHDQGRPRLWIFAHVSIQRYIAEQVRASDEDRNVSVFVGCNRDRFAGGWDYNTTLINLRVKRDKNGWRWESGVESLLDGFSARRLLPANSLFSAPQNQGNYAALKDFERDEYYIVYAEGRTFGDERERKHQVKTGTTLRERSQIIAGVLALLGAWLQGSTPLQKDIQNPENTFALRDYDYMVDEKRKDQTKQQVSWRTMLATTLKSGGQSHLHMVVLWRSGLFREWAQKQITEALMGIDVGDSPLATVTFLEMQPMLYVPIDTGGLPHDYMYLPKGQKTREKTAQWKTLMREGYGAKREQWRAFVQGIDWRPGARRLLLVDSTGEFNIHSDRKIKGAVRDACHREGVLTQFIVGDSLKLDTSPKRSGKLIGQSSGKLQNAVLDLLIRQQGILYAPPSQIYEHAAGLDSGIACRLDIISFCRVERTTPVRLKYALAVRLRANGEVAVLLPGNSSQWVPYENAAHVLGRLFSDERPALMNPKAKSPLRLGHEALLNFVYEVLTKHLERPTVAVIEAEGWRNSRGKNEQRQCWAQLQNGELYRYPNVLRFDNARVCNRKAPALDFLLGVVRLRMNGETPQYVTAIDWANEEPMRDIPHLTGYVDPCVPDLLHYFSVAGLPETQKDQKNRQIMEQFRGDLKANKYHDIAYKHAQLIEMVPFFVHPSFDDDQGRRLLCRCVHFLRISPAFTMGDIAQPYPMHLGETLVEDQLVIVNADA
jgi:hypothetical protein